jgi:DNA-binding LytR/AlgR family response regulator
VNVNLIGNILDAYQQINNKYKSRFLVKVGQSIHSIQIEAIHHFVTHESLTFLVGKVKGKYPIDFTLDQLETLLDPKLFFRINRKIIIQINSIEKVDSYFNGRLAITSKLLEGDLRIVSRDRVNDFKKWLDN